MGRERTGHSSKKKLQRLNGKILKLTRNQEMQINQSPHISSLINLTRIQVNSKCYREYDTLCRSINCVLIWQHGGGLKCTGTSTQWSLLQMSILGKPLHASMKSMNDVPAALFKVQKGWKQPKYPLTWVEGDGRNNKRIVVTGMSLVNNLLSREKGLKL